MGAMAEGLRAAGVVEAESPDLENSFTALRQAKTIREFAPIAREIVLVSPDELPEVIKTFRKNFPFDPYATGQRGNPNRVETTYRSVWLDKLNNLRGYLTEARDPATREVLIRHAFEVK